MQPFPRLHCLVEAHMDVIPESSWLAHISTTQDQPRTSSKYLPMVLGNIPTILHRPPRSPALDAINRRVPDLLAPNDILEIQSPTVVHNPLGNLATRHSGNTTSIRAHEIDSLAHTMIRRSARRAVTNAVDLPDPPRESSNNLLGTRHGDLLARAHGRVSGG